jgi:hypothetical protein
LKQLEPDHISSDNTDTKGQKQGNDQWEMRRGRKKPEQK